MRTLLFAAASFLFTISSAYGAAKQSGTFTCTSGLSLPLSGFYLELNAPGEAGTSAASFVRVTTDVAQFQPLLVDVLSGRLDDSCEVQVSDKKADATPALKFLDVDILLVSVTGDSQSQYVTATFSFSKIEDLATSSTSSIKGASALTPDERHKALTEFLVRAPKTGAN